MRASSAATPSAMLLAMMLPALGIVASCGDDGATGSGDAPDVFCDGASDALEDASDPASGAQLVAALRAIETGGLDDGDQRAFAGMVSALESSVEAFNTGGSQNGWTTDPLASFVGRLCGATPDGFYVVP